MKRGEIWLVNLDPTLGAEIKKQRPAVIISSDLVGVLPLKVVIPITGWKDSFAKAPWMVKITPSIENGLEKISSADCLQIRSVSEERLVKKLGKLAPVTLKEILAGIQQVIAP
jgi:mRNA interferase MazF